jgi:transcriptional regulator with XRE-family HTH domain
MAELQKRLGNRIRRLRKSRGWSQKEFAAISRLHPGFMGEIERGETNPSISTMQRLARHLKTTVSKLFRGIA